MLEKHLYTNQFTLAEALKGGGKRHDYKTNYSLLDVKEGRVVKGIQFVELRDAGDPVELARFMMKQGADELVFLDISASHEGRKTMVEVVEQVAGTAGHSVYSWRRN